MQTAAGGSIQYEPDWSDKWEPYAAGLGLTGDAIGIGAAATGVGIPAGTFIAGMANIPNLVIDGYQSGETYIEVLKIMEPVQVLLHGIVVNFFWMRQD